MLFFTLPISSEWEEISVILDRQRSNCLWDINCFRINSSLEYHSLWMTTVIFGMLSLEYHYLWMATISFQASIHSTFLALNDRNLGWHTLWMIKPWHDGLFVALSSAQRPVTIKLLVTVFNCTSTFGPQTSFNDTTDSNQTSGNIHFSVSLFE